MPMKSEEDTPPIHTNRINHRFLICAPFRSEYQVCVRVSVRVCVKI